MSPAIRNGRREVTVLDLTPEPHPPGPVERIVAVRPVLPCDGCAHARVCSIRPLLDVERLELHAPPSPHPALRFAVRIETTCEHFLAGPDGARAGVTEAARRWHEDQRRSSASGTRRSIEVRAERKSKAVWTPEMRAAQSERVKAAQGARKGQGDGA